MHVLCCADGSRSAAVKRLTDEKLLRAEVRIDESSAGGVAGCQRRVILYDRLNNINSIVAEHRITFTADPGEIISIIIIIF